MQVEKWHEWRNQGLGSSDAPIIMGVSPWSTPYQLWEQKTKRTVKDFSNWATQRGNRLEPAARALYEFQFGLEMPATLVVNQEYPFIRASLDGYNHENRIILEIKCPGKDDHQTAIDGSVPDKYLPQVHHQLLACPAAKAVHYWSYDGEKGVRVEVKRDLEYSKKLFDALCKFWRNIQDDKEPTFTDRDFKKIKDANVLSLLKRYENALANLKCAQADVDHVKEAIFNDPNIIGQRCMADKWRINLISRKGSIDYAKVPELQGIDLERYRKPSSVYRTISEKGKE